MADIKERLDNLRIHIQEPEFLEGKVLAMKSIFVSSVMTQKMK